MIKKTITYTDFNGDEQTEDFYFNLSKAEIAEMELSTEGGFGEYIQKVVESNKGKDIIENFKKIIGLAYGRRSEDGKRFIKSKEITEEFFSSEAYSEFFIEILTDSDKGAEFVNGLVPADLNGPVAPKLEKNAPAEDEKPKAPKDMTREELMAAFMEKNKGQLGQGSLGQ